MFCIVIVSATLKLFVRFLPTTDRLLLTEVLIGGNFQRHVHKCLWETDVKCTPSRNHDEMLAVSSNRPRWLIWCLTGKQWLQQSCEYSKAICEGWVSELQCRATLCEYWTLMAWGAVWIVKGRRFPTGPAVWGWGLLDGWKKRSRKACPEKATVKQACFAC